MQRELDDLRTSFESESKGKQSAEKVCKTLELQVLAGNYNSFFHRGTQKTAIVFFHQRELHEVPVRFREM